MRLLLISIIAMVLAGCASDPLDTGHAEMDYLHAQSWQAARAMRGKEYVFVARATVCADKDAAALGPHLFNPLPHGRCTTVTVGRFRVVDTVLMKNGSTLLQISGDGVAGYTPYEIFLPQPYKSVSEYFPTGK